MEDYTQKELEDFLSFAISGKRSHPKLRCLISIFFLTLAIIIFPLSYTNLTAVIIITIIMIPLSILAVLWRIGYFIKFRIGSGDSNYPTIHDGDILRVQQIYASLNNLEVGDFITFQLNPDQNELAYEKTSNITRDEFLCKRIIKISPEGVYVCGDNENSLNSDVYGLVPFENIFEKVINVVGIQKNRNGRRKFFTREIKKTKFVSVQKEIDRNEEYNEDQYDEEECNLYENNSEEIKSGKSAESYFDIGLSKFESEEYDEALECFQKALELDKQNPEIYIFIGVCKLSLEEHEEAIDYLHKAIMLDDSEPESYLQIAGIKYELGEYKEAIDYYQKAIALDANNPDYYLALGSVYVELENYNEAIISYKKALEIDSNIAHSYGQIGLCFLAQNNYSEAFEQLVKSLEIDPKEEGNDLVYRGLGFLLNESSYYQKALDTLLVADELYPNNILIHKEILRSYKFLENQEKVKEYLEKIDKLEKESQ